MKRLICAALLAASFPAMALSYFLEDQWVKNGSRFCKYGNGTILNVGINLCPLSIEG